MQRSTRQLITTYEVLAAASDHPTAEQILLRVRARLPRVSLGTVYRNLEKLRAQGRLRVVNIGPGVARYDALLTDHDHFFCEACAAVIDVPPPPDQGDVQPLCRAGYVVRVRSVVIYGLCRGCARAGFTGSKAPMAVAAVSSRSGRRARASAVS
jgi:Fe2+ or Zn2+ uptake regulation protein